MATILPAQLPRAIEYENISYSFSYTLLGDEQFVSLKILDFLPNNGIIVNQNNASFSGSYRDSFDVDSDALQYILKINNEKRVTNSWDDLPDPKTADLVLWRAPKSMTKNYWYEVELSYLKVSENESGGTTTTPMKLTQKIYQTVYGNWSIWGEQLRNYVNASISS